jgi:hydrogenase maturation factor
VCLGEIGRVTAVDAATTSATVTVGAASRRVSTLLTPGLAPGDHVLLHSGHTLEILDPSTAADALALRPVPRQEPR